MDKSKETSLIAACQDFFGRKPDQTLQEFTAEFKLLTEKDKAELAEMLRKQGYNIK